MRRAAALAFVIALTVGFTQGTAGAITVTGPTNFAVGSNPLSLATGDFNGDTEPDLAVANYLSNNVSILIGNGAGGFGGPTNFAVGARPTAVAVGDFNRDTVLDLAVANFFSRTVSILIGNGLGGFTGPTNLAAAGKPISIAVGNFNADTDPDLAVANNANNNVSILLGNGLGGFTGPTNFAAGFGPTSVAAGNFDGDTSLDLAVVNNGGNNVSILTGNGAGGFTGPTNFAVGSLPYSVAVGNFNGDTDPDLAVTNYSSSNVSILLGGTGATFTGPTNFPAGSGPYGIAVRDVDGDTQADLTVGNIGGNRITILIGNGLGGFASPVGFPVASGHHSVAVEDFNSDSAPDFAVTNAGANSISILLQTQETVAAVGDVSRAEGDTGQTGFAFQVTLASASTDPVSVDYHTQDGTATIADFDYTPLPVQTLTFAPGETSKTVTVNVTGDIEFEPDENFTLVLSNPVNASISDGTGVGTIQNDDQQGYPRPAAARMVETSLVPAFRKCNAPNLTHGPALEHPSCGPPVPLSQYLTVGTPDANGRLANAVGAVRYEVMPGDPGTEADEADVGVDIDVRDVRGSVTLGDYIAELWATVGVRLTDRANVAPARPETTADFQFSLAVPCASTADPAIGAACSVSTTADAVLPGSAPEKTRAIWQLAQVQVQDGGEDGEGATTADNTLFMKQGIFVP